MKIESVMDPSFDSYGRVVKGMDGFIHEILPALEKTPLPEATAYTPSEPLLESLSAFRIARDHLFGGADCELGWCNGHNTKLNCLEYHRSSEFNLGTEDFILLLAKMENIRDGKLDTSAVRAFRVPAGVLVEVYATTLHYAPCHTDPARGFRVMVGLPAKTNTEKPDMDNAGGDDAYLTACNKWLLAHPDSDEAKSGAVAALTGENIDIADLL
ncbi:MAG: DUF4867 family protein [Bilifractor sp.]|jgi:hypothetical protein